MIRHTGWAGFWAILLQGTFLFGQTLNNQSLKGKYFFRQVSLGASTKAAIVDPRSIIGSMTFDGAGHFSYAGQQVAGGGTASPSSGSGTYSVDPAGFVTMDNPLRAGDQVNARFGPEALVGSSTEATDGSFDMFVAIPAPSSGSAQLSGAYWVVTLEFPGGDPTLARNTFFGLSAQALGQIPTFSVTGHAANLNAGVINSQSVTGATWTMAGDGSGSINFGTPDPNALVSGTRTLYQSADGAVILGGSPGSHDFVIGVQAAANPTIATWSGSYWGAGLRYDLTDSDVESFAGSAVARGTGAITWSRRLKTLGAGTLDFTGVNHYTFSSDGSATVELDSAGLGAGAKVFVASDLQEQHAYDIYFGALAPTLSGSGVFLNPQGVVNAASLAPAGNPISPGEFITLFGSGLAKTTGTASPPYPPAFNNVTVLINGKAAPIYYVSGTQINCLVPYSTTGPTATILVQNGTTNSNTVTVPVAATSPGIYTLDTSGTGLGAILHADYSLVNAAKPAVPGETVAVYLTGMGAVSPSVADGTAGKASPLSYTQAAPLTVYLAGQPAQVVYSGLAPGYPGLYQLNITLPSFLLSPGNLPLAIESPNAFHDQVQIAVQ